MQAQRFCSGLELAPRSRYVSVSISSAAPSAARRGVSSAAVSASPIGSARQRSIGPVSSPASICMIVTPVSVSPLAIAQLIGAAPRYFGSSDECTLMQPRRGAASIQSGRIRP